MTKHQYSKLNVHDIGYHASRKCTDIWAALLLAVFWVLLCVLAGSAFKHGNLKPFLYGTDYLGNTCGGSLPSNVAGISAQTWSTMNYLWYPIAYDTLSNQFHLSSALSMGICVSQCPTVGSTVWTYTMPGESTTVANSYLSLFNSSSVVMGRCIPNFLSFDCNSAQSCLNQLASQGNRFTSMLGVGGVITSGIEELKSNIGIVIGLSILALVLSFLWLVALRVLVKPLVILTAILLAVAGVAGGFAMFHFYSLDTTTDVGHAWLAGAIICWIITFLYLCLLVYLRRDLNSACQIIEEASRVPVEMPKLAIVPVITAILIVLLSVFLGVTAVAIHTSGSYEPQIVYDAAHSSNVKVVQYAAQNWRTIGLLYNLFMFLWTVGFLNAICHIIIALSAVSWYWSVPGERKEPPSNALSWSTITTFRYHIGTVALGSFLIAVVQFLRALMRIFENRLRVVAERNAAAKILLCCANCCLACFERVVALLTKNAYVMTAMTGEGLFPAARQALSLLLSNRAAIAVNLVSEGILVIGKVLITALVIFISWLAITHTNPGQSGLLFCVVMGLTAFFVASVFATVFSVCIDTVLLSYCVDKEENNGADRPYYFPESLHRHVDAAQEHKEGGSQSASNKEGYGHIAF
jgi:hypothetical protein